jgi:glycosyltransferase involved in cell wall biosynthesis
MRFCLVTPSFNQLTHLRRCVASICDQQLDGFELRHEVIDGASTDGTVEWLESEGVPHISEPDEGMYDALNKGIDQMCSEPAKLTDTIFAWLNADEQYLPGTLAAVAEFFEQHQDVDLLCGDALVVDANGRLLTYWKSLPLRRAYLRIGTLYNLTCAMFFRGRVFANGLRFNVKLQAVADLVLVEQLLTAGVRPACRPGYIATYTYAKDNISNQVSSIEERLNYIRSQSIGQRWLAHPLARLGRVGERFLRGARRQSFPLIYDVYIDDLARRTTCKADVVSARWPVEAVQ